MRLEEESRLYFERGCNCAQSVFTPIAKRLGMNPSIALKIAAPFGGGMSHMGQTCGAVTGGVMGIGLAEGAARHDTVQEAVCSELAVAFQNRFIELHGDLTCPGLLELDLGDPVQRDKVIEENLFTTCCLSFVGDAARIAEELLELT